MTDALPPLEVRECATITTVVPTAHVASELCPVVVDARQPHAANCAAIASTILTDMP